MRIVTFVLFILSFSQLANAQISEFQYLSPKPNSKLNSRKTNIILLQGSLIDRSTINGYLLLVEGSLSGIHEGRLILSDDNKTLIFKPSAFFSPNEKVTIKLLNGIKTIEGKDLGLVEFSFKISPLKGNIDLSANQNLKNDSNNFSKIIPNVQSDTIPPDFPVVTVGNSNNPYEGNIFIANKPAVSNTPYGNYIMIVNNNGNIIKYKKFSVAESNFKVLPNGELSFSEIGMHIVTDTTLTPIDTFQCGNGYIADSHDFLLLPNGHALLFASDPEPVDLSQIVPGGKPDATVIGAVIQELDASKNVVFQWRTWDYPDYIPFTSSYIDLTNQTIDYVHGNSLEVDNDGNILFSMRHTSNIIKINRSTGDVIWILGGKKNQFTFINDHESNSPNYFSFQHNVSVLPDGDITLFDNGDQHSPQYSRGVEYKLDEQKKTATMVWEYRHTPDIYTASGGSVQRLPNGNTIIGWSRGGSSNGNPIFTEVHPDNSMALEMYFPEGEFSYRSYKFPWGNQNSPEEVNITNIFAGNTYEFNKDSDSTGVTVTFNQFDGNIYADVSVIKYSHAPIEPDFSGTAPLLISSYFKMSGQLVNSFSGEMHVDLDKYPGIAFPKKTILYVRPEFSRIFIPLPTSYDSSMNQFVFTATDFGDFVFGIPQKISAYRPVPIAPKASEIVNGETEVNFMWGIPGIFNSFHLQIAADSLFNNVVIDNTDLKSTFLTIKTLNNNTEYYWRLNNTNSAGTSEWSDVFKFYTESPYIKIVYPNGGENIFADSSYIIRWESNVSDTLDIDLIKGTEPVSVIAGSITSRTNAIAWQVPLSTQLDSSYKIRVTSINHSNLIDESDNSFTIGRVTGISELKTNVKENKLYQNFPNPFNPSTVISYMLAKEGFVTLKIYDLLGREIATLVQAREKAGIHSVTFKPNKLSSGVYIYSLHTGNYFRSKKLILLR